MLRARILGAAAGGGLPQWNCGCRNCDAARAGRIPAATQSSLAVSAGGRWAVVNASPDIRSQMLDTPALHPTGPRCLPLASVLVTNGDIDHIAGLLILREQQPFTLFATPTILETLDANPIFDALDRDLVLRRPIALDTPFELAEGVTATLFAVPGKVPLFLEGDTVETGLEGEQTVGVALEAGGRTAFYIPGCAHMTQSLAERLRGALLVLFDGTVFQDDEMIVQGVGRKTGQRMGHMAMQDSLRAFDDLDVARKVFVHINNTNPAWDPSSDARAAVEAAGWTVGQDGMEIEI